MVLQWFEDAVEIHRVVRSEEDYQAIWSKIDAALSSPTDAFNEAVSHLQSPDPSQRAIAVDALGQIGCQVHQYRSPALRHLLRAATGEKDADVQWSIVFALSHLADPAALPTLVEMRTNKDPDVRYQVAQALARVASKTKKAQASRTLIEFLDDSDPGVRKKAQEALHQITHLDV